MAVTRTVRVIRIWDVTVDAEYGDTPDSLCAKVTKTQLRETAPDAETRQLLEDSYSPVGKYSQLQVTDPGTAPVPPDEEG